MAFKILILGSGRGSNAARLLEAEAAGELAPGVIHALVSDHPEAGIRGVAERFGKPFRFLDPGKPGARFTASGLDTYRAFFEEEAADLIVLAGFMRILPAALIEAARGRLINLHPSLLPAFPGLDALGQALAAGTRYAGCTVHWVSEGVDTGPIIDQTAFRLPEGITRAEAEALLAQAEHSLLPEVVARLARQAG